MRFQVRLPDRVELQVAVMLDDRGDMMTEREELGEKVEKHDYSLPFRFHSRSYPVSLILSKSPGQGSGNPDQGSLHGVPDAEISNRA